MKGPKIQENCAPLIRRPPAQRGLRGPKLRHCSSCVGLIISSNKLSSLVKMRLGVVHISCVGLISSKNAFILARSWESRISGMVLQLTMQFQ